VRVAHEVFGDRAQEEPIEPSATVRSHDDQIRIIVDSDLGDRVTRLPDPSVSEHPIHRNVQA
jgi:hypothetical protein